MIMIAKNYSWLLAALFMLLGVFSAQAQEEPMECLSLDIQHVESDFVPAEQCNYYRNFFTLDNISGEGTINVWRIAAGDDHFILYRYPTIDGAIPTAVAELKFTIVEAGVNYEITYLNQEPLEGYDLELVTEGTLEVENYLVNFDDIVLVDQLRVALENESMENYGEDVGFDYSKVYYWTPCCYVMKLAEDEAVSTNTVEVPIGYGGYLYVLGTYSRTQIESDREDAHLVAGLKNAYLDLSAITQDNPDILGYSILRGNNTYPTDTISNLVYYGNYYIEECDALPDYFGNHEMYGITRMDTAQLLYGNYGDYLTYVSVARTNGEDRVKKDGDNTYGSTMTKTGVANLDMWVNGFVTDHNSDDPFMWKDENGEDCTIFNPIFSINIAMPDYATWEYKPDKIRVWAKCDNFRDFYVDEDGNVVNIENPVPNNLLLLEEMEIEEGHWDYDLDEYVYDEFTGQITLGEPDSYIYAFGATYASKEGGISFLVRFYYEPQVPMPLKGAYPSWMPSYCIVEKEIPWIIDPVITSVKEIGSEIEVGKTYYNVQGVASDKPFSGFNIEVTRYGDGSTKSKKVML